MVLVIRVYQELGEWNFDLELGPVVSKKLHGSRRFCFDFNKANRGDGISEMVVLQATEGLQLSLCRSGYLLSRFQRCWRN